MEIVERHEKEVGATTDGKVVVEQLLDAQLAALGSLQDWSKWLVGINAGVLGLLVFAAQRIEHPDPAPKGITFLILAIISFCVSLTIATWLVGAVPAFIMRLKAHDTWSEKIWWIDWRAKNIYGFKYGSIPLQGYSALQHLFFVAGVILLTISLSLSLDAGRQLPNTPAPADQKTLFLRGKAGMPSWADQMQAISTAIGVFVTIGGFLLVYRQIRQISQASRANAHAAIFAHSLEITRLMLENLEVKPYLSDGKELAEEDPLFKEVELVCEMFGDFYEHVSLQRENLPEQSRVCWDKAIAFRYQKSSALRNYIDKHRSFYAAALFASIERGKELLGISGTGKQ